MHFMFSVLLINCRSPEMFDNYGLAVFLFLLRESEFIDINSNFWVSYIILVITFQIPGQA